MDGETADAGAQDGRLPVSPTVITIIGPSTVSVGERFPLDVPEDVIVEGQGGVTVQIPDTLNSAGAFALSYGRLSLSHLVLWGQICTTYAILVASGSEMVTVRDVEIANFQVGIQVQDSASVLITSGVSMHDNISRGAGPPP